ncbi:ABC transporter G family member 9 [Capsicum chinense]|nr:ABC transporter G family member 9 [Capsicum chinense]
MHCGGPSSTKEKTILNGVIRTVCLGEIIAMLGPSGSGKTTLLTALGGYLSGKLFGKITYDSHPFSGSNKCRTRVVAQDDVLYPHLTVIETLVFTTLLRLPQSIDGRKK